jgi:hypothetical protein
MDNLPSERQIVEAIERILHHREFGGAVLWNNIADFIKRALSGIMNSAGGLGLVVMIGLVAVMVFCLAWLIYSERRRRLLNHPKRLLKGETIFQDLLVLAEDLARKEDWTGALLTLYAQHLYMLQGQEWIVLGESKTGLQYQWELLGKGYDDVEGFDAFRRVFNRVRYGGYSELKETYEFFLAYCRKKPERRQAA